MGIKYAVNEKFFDVWSADMAYVLGYWFADGSIEYAPGMRGKYIRVGSTDKEIIQVIRKRMNSQHSIVATERPGRKTYYLLRIGDAVLFDTIKKYGVTERKSRHVACPTIPQSFIGAFVRGYFDGDGCVYLEKNNQGGYKRLTTIFTSGSKKFLLQLQKQLTHIASMSSHISIVETKGGFSSAFQLRYSTSDSIKLYRLMYDSHSGDIALNRKLKAFKEFLSKKSRWRSG